MIVNTGCNNPRRYESASFRRLYNWLVFTSIIAWLLTIGIIPIFFVIAIGTAPDSPDAGAPFPIAMLLSVMFAQLIVFAAIAGALIAQSIFLHRAWKQIQDGDARTTPQLAVGFMFIPYYNMYWIFVAIWGLAKDMDNYITERGIDARSVRTGLPLAACITSCTLIIPLVNILTLIVILPMWLIAMNEIKRASMAIAASGN